MNQPPVLDWPAVEAAIGTEQTTILRRNNVSRKRWKWVSEVVLIVAAVALITVLLLFSLR